MADVAITIDGQPATVPEGTTVAAALWLHGGVSATRRSVRGEPRAALCGMGICFECRVTIDGRSGVRGCMTRCTDGMRVETA